MSVDYWKLMLRWDNELRQIHVVVRWVNRAVSPNENNYQATLSIYVHTGPVLPVVTAPILSFVSVLTRTTVSTVSNI